MAAQQTFKVEKCGDCMVYFSDPTLPGECGRCRLQPPTPLNDYSSTYPVVRKDNPACFAGKRSVAKKKGAPNVKRSERK